VQLRLQEAEIDLDLAPEIGVVVTTGLEEGMNRRVAYVRGTTIFLSRMALGVDLPHTVAHEVLDLYTGTHGDKRAPLYKLIGFEKEPDFRLPADLEARRITNPDEMYFDHKVEVEYQAQKYWVIPVMLATGAYSAFGLLCEDTAERDDVQVGRTATETGSAQYCGTGAAAARCVLFTCEWRARRSIDTRRAPRYREERSFRRGHRWRRSRSKHCGITIR
jgi:hypothetical protein